VPCTNIGCPGGLASQLDAAAAAVAESVLFHTACCGCDTGGVTSECASIRAAVL
jgi:hypothetical protein